MMNVFVFTEEALSEIVTDCAMGAVETLIPLSLSRWETPEQYLKRTGKPWPNNWAVYCRIYIGKPSSFSVYTYNDALRLLSMTVAHTELDIKYHIVCATEAGIPPDDWRPEEEIR
jgi:hypothetical protein